MKVIRRFAPLASIGMAPMGKLFTFFMVSMCKLIETVLEKSAVALVAALI